MMLQALYEFAERNRLNEQLAFQDHAVRWLIPINQEGEFISDGLIDLSTKEHKKGKVFSCPSTIRSKKAGGVSEFLTDSITSVFGVESDIEKFNKASEKKQETRIKNNKDKHDDFWSQIDEALQHADSPILHTMQKWKDKLGDSQPDFLRWGALKEGDKEKWLVKTPTGEIPLGAGDFFAFEVGGVNSLDDEQLKKYWLTCSLREREERDKDATRGYCLVSGREDLPVMRSHPGISGVPGSLPTGAYMVSFSATKAGDACAFSSFGWKKGENATISTTAAEAYASALNHLISSNKHRIRLGPSIMTFWTKQSDEYANFLTQLMETPSERSVKDFVSRWKAGVDEPLQNQDRFYSLMLSGNAGRVVVRRWIDQPLTEASEHIKQWFDDLSIEYNHPKKSKGDEDDALPYALFRLACTTVRDAKDLPTETSIRLFSAALEGASLPLSWLKLILHRFKCALVKREDKKINPYNPSRFALIKLILIRNHKGDTFMPDVKLSETLDKPYNLGRLMAVLQYIQEKAHSFQLEGAGVIDKYYASASANPATTFPYLIRLSQHHIRKIRQTEKGSANALESKKSEILSLVQSDAPGQPPKFPRTLNLEEQGRFALGFYQQKAYDASQRQSHKNKNNETN